MTKRETTATALLMLAGAYNRELAPEGIEAYWLVLRDVPDEQIARATKRALAECRFMPTPAELLVLAGVARNLPAEIAQAWEAVRAAVRKHDYMVQTIDFGPRVNAVVRNMGGWQALCDRPRDQLDVWGRKEFERIYTAFADSDPRALNGGPLVGWLAGRVGGSPITIAIEGQPSVPTRDAIQNRDVRKLADAKS